MGLCSSLTRWGYINERCNRHGLFALSRWRMLVGLATAVLFLLKVKATEVRSGDISDVVVYTGKVFIKALRSHPVYGGPDVRLKLTVTSGSQNVKLPGWLHFNSSTRVLSGVPLKNDVGKMFITIAAKCGRIGSPATMSTSDCIESSNLFRLEVLPSLWTHTQSFDSQFAQQILPISNVDNNTKDFSVGDVGCEEDRVIASLVLCEVVAKLTSEQRLSLISHLSSFLSIPVSTISLEHSASHMLKAVENGFHIIFAGPGTQESLCPLEDNTELMWWLPCTTVDHLNDFIRVLQHNVEGGRLQNEIRREITGWYVASSNSLSSKHRRRRRVYGEHRTVQPTPVLSPLKPTKYLSISEIDSSSKEPLQSHHLYISPAVEHVASTRIQTHLSSSHFSSFIQSISSIKMSSRLSEIKPSKFESSHSSSSSSTTKATSSSVTLPVIQPTSTQAKYFVTSSSATFVQQTSPTTNSSLEKHKPPPHHFDVPVESSQTIHSPIVTSNFTNEVTLTTSTTIINKHDHSALRPSTFVTFDFMSSSVTPPHTFSKVSTSSLKSNFYENSTITGQKLAKTYNSSSLYKQAASSSPFQKPEIPPSIKPHQDHPFSNLSSSSFLQSSSTVLSMESSFLVISRNVEIVFVPTSTKLTVDPESMIILLLSEVDNDKTFTDKNYHHKEFFTVSEILSVPQSALKVNSKIDDQQSIDSWQPWIEKLRDDQDELDQTTGVSPSSTQDKSRLLPKTDDSLPDDHHKFQKETEMSQFEPGSSLFPSSSRLIEVTLESVQSEKVIKDEGSGYGTPRTVPESIATTSSSIEDPDFFNVNVNDIDKADKSKNALGETDSTIKKTTSDKTADNTIEENTDNTIKENTDNTLMKTTDNTIVKTTNNTFVPNTVTDNIVSSSNATFVLSKVDGTTTSTFKTSPTFLFYTQSTQRRPRTRTTSTTTATTQVSTTSTTTKSTTTTTKPTTTPTATTTTTKRQFVKRPTTPKEKTNLKSTPGWDDVYDTDEEHLNNRPYVQKSIRTIKADQGKLFELTIPHDVFYDIEDGDTRHLSLSLELPSSQTLPSSFWLYLDSAEQIIRGLPLHEDMDIKNTSIVLVARDAAGMEATDYITLQINDAPRRSFTHVFRMKFAIHFQQFMRSRRNITNLVDRVATFFGDSGAKFMTVLEVRPGSFVLSWSNNTLTHTTCQTDVIKELYGQMVRRDGTVRSSFSRHVGRHLHLKDVLLEPLGVCTLPLTTTTTTTITTTALIPTTTNMVSEITGQGFNIWAHVVLPVLIAVLVFILIILIVIFCNRKRRQQQATINGEKEAMSNDCHQFIFPPELDADNSSPKTRDPPSSTVPLLNDQSIAASASRVKNNLNRDQERARKSRDNREKEVLNRDNEIQDSERDRDFGRNWNRRNVKEIGIGKRQREPDRMSAVSASSTLSWDRPNNHYLEEEAGSRSSTLKSTKSISSDKRHRKSPPPYWQPQSDPPPYRMPPPYLTNNATHL